MPPSPARWYGRLVSGWESLRESYWFLPMLMTLGSAGLALGIVEIDRSSSATWAARLPWIRDAGPDGTRAVLGAIAGSMITVTGVVFSVTIVALTLASSQFGPRLLRNFLRDRGNQLVLGSLVATFLYTLLVLRAVGEEGSVPHLAASVAVLLATLSLFILIYFIHHAASSIQASSVIAAVTLEIEQKLPTLFPESLGDDAPAPSPEHAAALEALDADGIEIASAWEGYIRFIDPDALMCEATENDLVIRLRRRPGDFVAVGTSLARIGPRARAGEAAQAAVRGAVVIGPQATAVQDLAFLTDQLTEMAVRALSPGINDPRTAIACVHRLGALIATLADRQMPSPLRLDPAQRLRVMAPSADFEEVVARCLDPIRRYGGTQTEVVLAVFEALDEAGRRTLSPDRRRVLAGHAAEFHESFVSGPPSKRDLDRVQAVHGPLVARLERQGSAV